MGQTCAGAPLRAVQVEGFRSPLFAAGDTALLRGRLVAIVGTRQPSSLGISRARHITATIVAAGLTVASGLALGIDAAVHRAAIEAGGRTIAVLGTPLERTYPAAHADLQAAIARDHLAISPFAPGAPIARGNFPMRDRLLAALSTAVVIVEAGDGSGTLHTVAEAVRLRRLVYLPHSLLHTSLVWPRQIVGRPGVHTLAL